METDAIDLVVRDGVIYLRLTGVIDLVEKGEVVMPEGGDEIRIAVEGEHLGKIASRLAQLGYVRI